MQPHRIVVPRRMDRRPQGAPEEREGADPHARPGRARNGARCPGSRSRRTTSSTPRTARRRSPNCSAATASSSSSTSCGGTISIRAASAARCTPTTPKARITHLHNHDVSFVAVSRAPLDKLQAYRKRMGWEVEWVSSLNSDFNFDYHVSFTKEQLEGRASLQLRDDRRRGRDGRAAGPERVLQGRARPHLPHLFELCARQRGGDQRVLLSRPHAERPQRDTRPWIG